MPYPRFEAALDAALASVPEAIVAADLFEIEQGSVEFRLSETLRFFAIPEEKPQTSKSAKSALPATCFLQRPSAAGSDRRLEREVSHADYAFCWHGPSRSVQ
jgi:hypothetical protein